MNRAKKWEEEIIHHFPSIDYNGVPATAEFIVILEEMGGFDAGAYLCYNWLTDNINIASKNCRIEPVYDGNQVSGFRVTFAPSSYLYNITPKILPIPDDIQAFLSAYWNELFPQDTEGE